MRLELENLAMTLYHDIAESIHEHNFQEIVFLHAKDFFRKVHDLLTKTSLYPEKGYRFHWLKSPSGATYLFDFQYLPGLGDTWVKVGDSSNKFSPSSAWRDGWQYIGAAKPPKAAQSGRWECPLGIPTCTGPCHSYSCGGE
jgi:hypothetical protein